MRRPFCAAAVTTTSAALVMLVLATFVPGTESCLCHVIPNFSCPPPPHCCESGFYTFDECGCCMTCAKAELQECGGPSNSRGKCAKGLACLKTCSKESRLHDVHAIETLCIFISESCVTIGSEPEPCVFPFRYNGQTFDRCTGTDASGNAVWCATEVDKDGDVIEGRWGDCNEGCPGASECININTGTYEMWALTFSPTGRECNDLRFSILEGRCINPAIPGAIPNWKGAPSYRLLKQTEDLFPAPLCRNEGTVKSRRRQYENTCRCAGGEDAIEISPTGKIRGNCTG